MQWRLSLKLKMMQLSLSSQKSKDFHFGFPRRTKTETRTVIRLRKIKTNGVEAIKLHSQKFNFSPRLEIDPGKKSERSVTR